MKAVVAAFNQEKALVGAFSVITNLRICFGWNFLKHYREHVVACGARLEGRVEHHAALLLVRVEHVVEAHGVSLVLVGEEFPCRLFHHMKPEC